MQRFHQGRHNSNNHHEFAPFRASVADGLVVDERWLQTLPRQTQLEILALKPTLAHVKPPEQSSAEFDPACHTVEHSNKKLFYEVYNAYHRAYGFERWYREDLGLPRCQLIRLDANDIELLRDTTRVRCVWDSKLPPADELAFLSSVVLDKPQFVKLAQTSGKHCRPVRPVANVRELLDVMTDNFDFLREYEYALNVGAEHPLHLVLQDWVDLSEAEEYRVFIHRGKLTAISRSNKYDTPPPPHFDMPTVRRNIIAWYADIGASLPASTVADLWVDASQQPHLIECNVWGAWAGAGSALFHWIDDYDLLHGGDAIFENLSRRSHASMACGDVATTPSDGHTVLRF